MATILDLYNKQTKLQELIKNNSGKLFFTTEEGQFRFWWKLRSSNDRRPRLLLTQTSFGTVGVLMDWWGYGCAWFSSSTKEQYVKERTEIGNSFGINESLLNEQIAIVSYPSYFRSIGLNIDNNLETSWAFAVKFVENFSNIYITNNALSDDNIHKLIFGDTTNVKYIKSEELKDLTQQVREISGADAKQKQEAEKQAELLRQVPQLIKDNEDLKKKLQTLEQEKKVAKDENEVLKGKIAKPLDNDEIKKLLLEIKGTTETNKTSLEELNEGLKNVPESIKRQMTFNFNTSETNLRTLTESLTTQIKDIKFPVVDLTGITTSLSEIEKDIEELPTKQSIEELETHVTNIKSNVNLNTDTKIAEINKKIGEIKIPTTDLTEINSKLDYLKESADDKPSDKQLEEVSKKVEAIDTVVKSIDTTTKAIKMPDVDKLKDKLQVIIENDNDKTANEVLDRVNNETTTIIVRDVAKKLTEVIDLTSIKTKLDEIETKIKASVPSSTIVPGSGVAIDYSKRFDGLQTLLGTAEQKLKDLEPLFDRFKELKEMVQQLIDAQPEEAQSGN